MLPRRITIPIRFTIETITKKHNMLMVLLG